MEDAALRETIEEAGVTGKVGVSIFCQTKFLFCERMKLNLMQGFLLVSYVLAV